ncbi:maleylpyruvate isomerase family mycothiol-dependent enzyme [Streptomyces sp. NPDC048172]|uniref:maleylpyruvate isomerase family mycothiol-dependent enzyme n=1 Tax=Streptomyces sp. NPDC048172 TaxID=3365505 RepID=UPI00371A7948
MAPAFTHTRYCDELTRQAALFREALAAAGPQGLAARVPTCPDWSLRELTVHLGGAYRWFGELVRTRATAMVPHEDVPGYHGPGDGASASASAEELDAWFAESARLAVEEMRAADPDARVWSWSTPAEQTAAFWARRATHETVVHRADACFAARTPFTVAPEVAADCLEEWLEILASPVVQDHKEEIRRLRDHAGKSLRLRAVEADPALRADWLIELTPEGFTWHRGRTEADADATATVHAPAPTDLLLLLYRRVPATDDRVEVRGDATLLDEWLARTSFE